MILKMRNVSRRIFQFKCWLLLNATHIYRQNVWLSMVTIVLWTGWCKWKVNHSHCQWTLPNRPNHGRCVCVCLCWTNKRLALQWGSSKWQFLFHPNTVTLHSWKYFRNFITFDEWFHSVEFHFNFRHAFLLTRHRLAVVAFVLLWTFYGHDCAENFLSVDCRIDMQSKTSRK